MNDHEITAAALKWHAANILRLQAFSQKRKEQQRTKERTGYAIASPNTDRQATEAKRLERAALRVLAKSCAKSQAVHIIDVVINESASWQLDKPSCPTLKQQRRIVNDNRT